MLFSLVIPCFNEADNIENLIKRINKIQKKSNIEIILVNNGSTDTTADILKKNSYLLKNIKVVKIEKNIGYGFGIVTGLNSAKGNILGWTHSDNENNLHDIMYAIEIYKKNNEEVFIKGLRKAKRPILDLIFSYGLNIISSIILKKKLWDITAQPTMFSKSFFLQWKNPPNDFSLDLFVLYMAKKLNKKIIRFNVKYLSRKKGQSKWNTGLVSRLKLSINYLRFILKLNKQSY